MPRHRARLIGWTYDDSRQEIHTPHGRIVSLHDVAQMLADHRDCRFDFAGPWTGWRMRGDQFYPPGHKRGAGCIKPDSWPLFRAYLDELNRRDSAAVGLPLSDTGRPRLYLASSR